MSNSENEILSRQRPGKIYKFLKMRRKFILSSTAGFKRDIYSYSNILIKRV